MKIPTVNLFPFRFSMPRRAPEGKESSPQGTGTSLLVEREVIARRAYELWEAEGRPEGQHLRHWQSAEEEFLKRGTLQKRAS